MAWPNFELVSFQFDDPEIAALALASAHLQELSSIGIPRNALGVYTADDRLAIVPRHRRVVAGSGPEMARAGGVLVRFGSSFGHGCVAIDPSTGEVVSLNGPEPIARLLNSSLDQLRRTVEAVTNRFPFYSGDSDPDSGEAEAAQNDIMEMVATIDPHACDEGGDWGEFPWDVGMGDYDTESVVYGPIGKPGGIVAPVETVLSIYLWWRHRPETADVVAGRLARTYALVALLGTGLDVWLEPGQVHWAGIDIGEAGLRSLIGRNAANSTESAFLTWRATTWNGNRGDGGASIEFSIEGPIPYPEHSRWGSRLVVQLGRAFANSLDPATVERLVETWDPDEAGLRREPDERNRYTRSGGWAKPIGRSG